MHFYIDSYCSFFFFFSNALYRICFEKVEVLRKVQVRFILIEAVPLEWTIISRKKKRWRGDRKKKKFSLETTDSRDYVFTFTRDENINNYDDRYN